MLLGREDKVCVLCGKAAKTKTCVHNNDSIPDNFQFHIQCVKDKYTADGHPRDVLRLLNIPYIHDLWLKAEETEEGQEIMAKYLRIIAPKKRYYPDGFLNSQFNPDDLTPTQKGEITPEMIARWGDLPYEDYKSLEYSYNTLIKLKAPSTMLEDQKYINNVLLEKRVKEAYVSGTGQDIRNIQDAYTKSLKDIGLDSATLRDANADKSLGQRIQEWEEKAPTPEVSKDMQDIDRIKNYFTKYFLTPLLRNLGKATEQEIAALNVFDSSEIPKGRD